MIYVNIVFWGIKLFCFLFFEIKFVFHLRGPRLTALFWGERGFFLGVWVYSVVIWEEEKKVFREMNGMKWRNDGNIFREVFVVLQRI